MILMQQDINEKENKIRDLNHRLEILSKVSESKLNDIRLNDIMESCLPNTLIDILPLQIRLLDSKWLILVTYKSPPQNERTYISEIQKLLTYYCSSHDSTLFSGDFNMSFSNKNMKDLCDIFELNHPIKDPTCFKGSNPSCVDNFYTNKKTTFFNSSTFEAGIPDHHSLICTILRLT